MTTAPFVTDWPSLRWSATLATRLIEQLHLGTPPIPAWHDRVCAELTPEAGASPTLPSLMELDVRRPFSPAEATDLIELGRSEALGRADEIRRFFL